MEDVQRMPLIGEEFPHMHVKTTQGEYDLPNDFSGKWFVLFSHPGDFTPVCTTEFYAFAKRSQQFEDLDCQLIGLSIDQLQSHLKWVEWIRENTDQSITFPVIADELGQAASKLGMISLAKAANTVRAVFIVDNHSKIRLIMYYPQELGRSVDEILRAVKSLQLADYYNVALAENYPRNELIGAKLIIPPAETEAEIANINMMVEQGKYECKDWWFCYQSKPK